MQRIRTADSGESGQSLIEYALISATLALLIFAMVDLGRAMSIYSTLAGAAQAAARTGSVSTDADVIEAAAQARMTSFNSESVSIQIVQTSLHTEVTLSLAFQPTLPFVASTMGADSIQLTNTARVRRLGGGGGGGGMAPTATPPAPMDTPPPPTSTPAATDTPESPTPTPCWPPGKCKNK